jgi:hypothetical protein
LLRSSYDRLQTCDILIVEQAPNSKGRLALVNGLPALLKPDDDLTLKNYTSLGSGLSEHGQPLNPFSTAENAFTQFELLEKKYPESLQSLKTIAAIFIDIVASDEAYYVRVQDFLTVIEARRKDERKRMIGASKFMEYMSELRELVDDYAGVMGSLEKENERLEKIIEKRNERHEVEVAELKDEKTSIKQHHLRELEAKDAVIAEHRKEVNDAQKEVLVKTEGHPEEISKKFNVMKENGAKRKQLLVTTERDNKYLEAKIVALQSQLDLIPQTDETLKREVEELKAERNVLRSRQSSKDMEKKIWDLATAKALVEPNKKIKEFEDKVEILEQGGLADHEVMVKYSKDIDVLKSEKTSFEEYQKQLQEELKTEKEVNQKKLQDENIALQAKLDLYKALLKIQNTLNEGQARTSSTETREIKVGRFLQQDETTILLGRLFCKSYWMSNYHWLSYEFVPPEFAEYGKRRVRTTCVLRG